MKTQGQVIMLPNQMKEEENKALGTGYLMEEDKLYIMTSVNFSKRKKKIRTGQNLLEDEVKLKTPNPLTRRHLLSQVAGLYDPTGLITPAKQKGLYKFLDKLQKSELEGETAKHGTEWSWKLHPASSPHRNGAAEAAVRIVKRALHNLGGHGVFKW
ncbi:hypothetical protein QTP86_018508, partial [Hemibagrus guttatus]